MAQAATKRSPRKAAPPPEVRAEIAATGNGNDITRPWVGELKLPADGRLMNANDWGIYKRILLDDQVFSTFQQRRGAVVSRQWDVLPGDDKDPRSVEAAEKMKANLEALGWDRITDKMLYAIFHGYAVAELLWEPKDGLWQWSQIRVRHARRFRIDKDDRLRLLTPRNLQGTVVPERKFWYVATGASDDDEPYGRGLAEWLYWPTLFKRNGIRFWNIFLDKFGTPTAKGTYRPGTPKEDIAKLLGALQAIATDSGFVVPEGMAVELLEVARSGTADYATLVRYMDAAIAKIVLSQTMTTDNGSSLSQAEVHADVKLEVIKADADLLSDSFNKGPARWWTDWNYGPDVAQPQVIRMVEPEEDLKAQAETDEAIDRLGWKRTEESFKDTYGDGYEPKPKADPIAPQPAKIGQPGGPPLDDDGGKVVADDKPARGKPPKPAEFAATDPRPLYVYRKLKNADDLIAWAKSQGFVSIIDADQLHVTVAYSRRPVNWFDMGGAPWSGGGNGDLVVAAGGPRVVDRLGDEGAVVLHFSSGDLQWRNKEMRDAGASWDYRDYHPHVTITYQAGDIDLAQVKAYPGELHFGPEIFEQLETDWRPRAASADFAAVDEGDVVDKAVMQIMADEGFTEVPEQLIKPLAEALQAASNEDEARAILKRGLDLINEAPLAGSLEAVSFAVQLAARAGVDG